jgi:hypothetical protein
MRTPSRASISARRRGIVQLRRSATGSLSNGAATRKAASLVTGAGPGAMLAFSAATQGGEVAAPEPNRILAHAKRLRDLGTGPARSVSSTARARSASRLSV